MNQLTQKLDRFRLTAAAQSDHVQAEMCELIDELELAYSALAEISGNAARWAVNAGQMPEHPELSEVGRMAMAVGVAAAAMGETTDAVGLTPEDIARGGS